MQLGIAALFADLGGDGEGHDGAGVRGVGGVEGVAATEEVVAVDCEADFEGEGEECARVDVVGGGGGHDVDGGGDVDVDVDVEMRGEVVDSYLASLVAKVYSKIITRSKPNCKICPQKPS